MNTEIPENRTVRWASSAAPKTYLSVSDKSPYLSVNVFAVDGDALKQSYDIDWEMWLEDPKTHEKIDYIPLMGGSCFIGDEWVSVYSTDNNIYTNIPDGTLVYNPNKYPGNGWYDMSPNTYDDPDYYALGVVGSDGVVKGWYSTPWDTGFACELTANLYELPVMVAKSVSGENSQIPADTEYRFRAGYNNPFNNNTFTYLGGYDYTIRNADKTIASTGNLPGSGEFSLKAGQTITIEGLQAINTPIQIEEFTASGTHTYNYYEYLEGTTAVANGSNTEVVQDVSSGVRYVRFNLSEATNIAFTNVLKKEIPTIPLKITKKVVGAATNEKFSFTATVEDGEFIEGEGYTIDNGQIQFRLGADDSITLNVSSGATVTVTETGYDGYYVKFTDGKGLYKDGASNRFLMEDDREITVTNTVGNPLPTTGGRGTAMFYILGASLLGGALIYGLIQRRKREKIKH